MDMIKKYGIWAAIVLCTLAFVAAGGGKLAGVPMLHESFAAMGLPGWFGYFIGAAEIAGGIGLLIRPLSALAAIGLAIIMVGASYFHVAYSVPSPVPALILLALTIYIFLQRRADMLRF